MILGVQTKVQQLIGQGKTLQEVLAAKATTPYDANVPGGLLPAGAARRLTRLRFDRGSATSRHERLNMDKGGAVLVSQP